MKNQKNYTKENNTRELWAVLALLAALFIGVCFYLPSSTGIIGKILIKSMIFMIGIEGLKFLPFFLFIAAISLFITSVNQSIILQASLLGLFCVLLTIECFHFNLGNTLPLPLKPYHCGWVGILGIYTLYKLVGPTGLIIFISGGGIIFLTLIFGFSISKFTKGILNPYLKNDGLNSENIQREKPISFLSKMKNWFLEPHEEKLIFPLENPNKDANFLSQSEAYQRKKPYSEYQNSSTDLDIETEHTSTIEDSSIVQNSKELIVGNIIEYKQRKTTFKLPPLSLLKESTKRNIKDSSKEKQEKAAILEETLDSFNVSAKVIHITQGPSVTRFELQPGEGVKISKITALAKDIALKLAVHDVRIEAPIPGKALVGIEMPNQLVDTISLKTLLNTATSKNYPSKLLAGMGLTITGDHVLMDLSRMPHILIAGATGSGKSVCVNTIILSILMRAKPEEVKFLMIDPKKVELSFYQDIPHLVAPVVTDPHKAAATLKRWALFEMEQRYDLFSKSSVKDIEGYNKLIEKENHQEKPLLPYIIVVIDELADLMMVASQEVEQTICRLAQMARATGIHLVVATQRPSVNVVTGLIKANIPSRISFFLQSQIDSRTILDMPGAEKLLGKGDMLYLPVGSFKPKRVQGVFVCEEEIRQVVQFLKQQGKPNYIEEILNVEPLEATNSESAETGLDPLFEEAKKLVMNTQYASTSYLQRKLRIGYNRAARIMDELEENGIISEYAGEKKPRSIV